MPISRGYHWVLYAHRFFWVNPCLRADPGPGPSFGGEHRPFEWGWRAVGLCSPCCGGGGWLCQRRCAAGGCARAVLVWGGLSGVYISSFLRYKTLFYFEVFVHESIILSLPPPTCIARTIAIRLHVHCALHAAPPDPPFVCHTPYNIGDCNIL